MAFVAIYLLNKVMCASFDLGYVLSDISDNGLTANSSVQRYVNVIHLRNISDFCLQSANRSYAIACVNVFQRLSTTDACRGITFC